MSGLTTMSVEQEVTQVNPSEDPVDESFIIVDFEGQGGNIHLSKYDDSFVCYWYTEKGLDQFLDAIHSFDNSRNISLDRIYFEHRDARPMNNITDGHNWQNLGKAMLDEVTYFGVNINSTDVYWAVEVASEDEGLFPHIVKINSPALNTSIFRTLYFRMAPSVVKNQEQLVSSVEEFIIR